MFGNRRSEKIFTGMVDMHSHILPGIDDGSRDMEQSVRMLRIAAEEGIHTIVATPHNMPGKGKAPIEKIDELAARLSAEAERQQIPVRVFPGCEVFFREEIPDMLERGELATLNHSQFLLTEFDYMADRSYIRNALKDILGLGYVPVLAHVERYPSLMEKNFTNIREFRKMRVRIQINASSVSGEAGREVQRQVKGLLKEKLVDFVSTDAHSDGRRAPTVRKCIKELAKWCPEDYVKAILEDNALSMFEIE